MQLMLTEGTIENYGTESPLLLLHHYEGSTEQ